MGLVFGDQWQEPSWYPEGQRMWCRHGRFSKWTPDALSCGRKCVTCGHSDNLHHDAVNCTSCEAPNCECRSWVEP